MYAVPKTGKGTHTCVLKELLNLNFNTISHYGRIPLTTKTTHQMLMNICIWW